MKQPWAWGIVHGGKDIENRVANLAGDYRGPVAIHAGKAWSEAGAEDWELRRALRSLELEWPASDPEVWAADTPEESDPRFVTGAIIGVVDLTDVHRAGQHYKNIGAGVTQITNVPCCPPWGMAQHRGTEYHLRLANPRTLATPIPWKGALGMRTLPDNVIEQIRAATT